MMIRVADMAWISKSVLSEHRIDLLKSILTFFTLGERSDPRKVTLYKDGDSFFGVPRAWFLKNIDKFEDIGYFIDDLGGRDVDLRFNGELRDYQVKSVNRFNELYNDDLCLGGVWQASPGWGKTVVALKMVSESRTNTLIVVNKEFLLDQWSERIEQFLPDAKVGIIHGDRCEYKNTDVSIALVQTLNSREKSYPSDFWGRFGMVITDEAHHVSAPTWMSVVPRFNCRFHVALTATPYRKDRADRCFFDNIGDIVYKSEFRQLKATLKRVILDTHLSSPHMKTAPRAVQINDICLDHNRNKRIVSELMKALMGGRKIIVLSERRNHLDVLRSGSIQAFKSIGKTSGFYIGGMKQDDLDLSAKCDVVFATYQMAQEALDIKELDTAFFVTPVGDIEQAVGRIQRVCEGKKSPLVVDFVDKNIKSFEGSYAKRMIFYRSRGMINE